MLRDLSIEEKLFLFFFFVEEPGGLWQFPLGQSNIFKWTVIYGGTFSADSAF